MTNVAFRYKTLLRQKLVLVLFGLCIAVILVEAGLRLGGFIILSLQEYKNLLSARGRATYRILCVGESTTQNQYPHFLEEILNQRNIGIRFSVIDKGLSGTDTSIIAGNIESYLIAYKPDIVVAMIGINDGVEYIPFERTASSKFILFIRSMKTYKFIRLLCLHTTKKIEEAKSANRPINTLLQPERQSKQAEIEEVSEGRIELSPKDSRSYYAELGLRYSFQGKLSLAEEAFKKGVESNPDDAGCYYGLGRLYQTQGKFLTGDEAAKKLSLAEEAYKKCIEIGPKGSYCYCYTGLGWVYSAQGKFSLAKQVFKKGIELNQEESYAGLGWVYGAQGKFSLAEEALKKGLELNPRDPRCFYYPELVRLYLAQGKFSLAEEALKKGLELNPENNKNYALLASVYANKGKADFTKSYYNKANELRKKKYNQMTLHNYHKIKEALDKRNVKLVCVQYPMRSLAPLARVFGADASGIIFVDNEHRFKEAVNKEGYREYFFDMFAGEFGHCTNKGNMLLAQNIANAILKEVFGIDHWKAAYYQENNGTKI